MDRGRGPVWECTCDEFREIRPLSAPAYCKHTNQAALTSGPDTSEPGLGRSPQSFGRNCDARHAPRANGSARLRSMYEATSKWHCTGRWIFHGCIGVTKSGENKWCSEDEFGSAIASNLPRTHKA
jgi:hypothetical protein